MAITGKVLSTDKSIMDNITPDTLHHPRSATDVSLLDKMVELFECLLQDDLETQDKWRSSTSCC